jgi:hypothetical protein
MYSPQLSDFSVISLRRRGNYVSEAWAIIEAHKSPAVREGFCKKDVNRAV